MSDQTIEYLHRGSTALLFITAPLIRNTVRPTTLLMLYTFISFIALFTVCLHPTFYVVIILFLSLVFTSAGGVVQIGLTLMAERFPYAKGKATGICYSAGSIATFTISVDYGLSVPRYCRYYVVRYRHRFAIGFYWHCLSAYATAKKRGITR